MRYMSLSSLLVIIYIGFNSIAFPQNRANQNDYEKYWRQIDSLDNLKMTQSAKKIAEDIYQIALSDKNDKQALKALIVRLSYERMLDFNNDRLIIKELKDGINRFKFPEKSILQSILAKEYWEYYRRNSYKLYQRSAVQNDSSSDFEIWSLQKLRDETERLFVSSIERSGDLKSIPASEYADIMIPGDDYGERYRPTLYDMLCHQALKCFTNGLFNIDKFDRVSDKLKAYGTAEEFIDAAADQADSSLIKDKAIKILKDLTLFHIHDNSQAELADIDLKRLDHMRNKNDNFYRDSLYLKALCRMLEFYKDSTSVPRILSAIASFYYKRSDSWHDNSEYRWDRKKALEYCEKAIKNYPRSFGAKESEAIKGSILSKSLSLQAENENLPDEPFRVSVTCQNADSVYFRIIEAASAKTDSVIKSDYARYNFYSTLKPYLQFIKTLPDAGDHYSHNYDIIFPSLPVGKYIVLASSDSGFSFSKGLALYRNIQITNLSAITKTENDKTEIYVLDRKSGNPLEGVKISLFPKQTFNQTGLGLFKNLTTDEDGYASIKIPSAYCNIIFSSGKDSMDMNYYRGDQYRNENADKISGETIFFTDRNIYRPGQTVFFKGLSMLHDNKSGAYEIWKDRTVTVSLYDANGRNINQLGLRTNEYGSFSGQFDLPEYLRNGYWELRDGFGTGNFRVEEYKRPQFEVLIDKIKGEYSLNDDIKVTGKALAYSGALLSGDEVRYRVERTSYYLYGNWRYLPGYRPYQSTEISKGSVKTGDNGDFTITFKAAADPKDEMKNPVYNYRIDVEVIDKTGETHKAEANVRAGYVSLLADIKIPEVIIREQKPNYDIVTEDLNGNFKATGAHLSITKLKTPERIFRKTSLGRPDTNLISKDEFYKLFKHDAYSDEKNYINWEKEKQVYDTTFITSENMSFEGNVFSHLEQGQYLLKFSAKDKNGRQAEIIRYFTFLDPKAEKIPLNDALWFYPFKTSAEPGEDLVISLGTALENLYILFEVEKKGKTIKREWLRLSNEQKLLEIPIKEKYRGNIILHCYAVWENSRISFSEDVIVPRSNKKLKLELETFRNKITPGETEQWKIKVKDHKGDPAEAEVLAAMYDKSLDALSNGNVWNFNIFKEEYRSSWWSETGSYYAYYFTPVNMDRMRYPVWPEITYNEFYYYGLFDGPYDAYKDKKYKSRTFEESLLGYPVFQKGVTILGSRPEVQKDATSATVISKEVKEEAFAMIRGGGTNALAFSLGVEPKDGSRNLPGLQPAENDSSKILQVIARKNLNETAFFFPHIITDDNGEAAFSFNGPEMLTKWKFMAFAHTKDLEYGTLTAEAVTQKKLMIQSYPPRFFRENDTIWFTSRISNLTDSLLNGKAALKCSDGFTAQTIDEYLGNSNSMQEFNLNPKETKTLRWRLVIPEGKFKAVNYKVLATGGDFTDGEENSIPVLSNEMLITESMALPVRGNESRSFIFDNLRNNRSNSLKNYKLTLEFTSNPAFLALQSLPSLIELKYESADNLFNSYLAGSIAMHIVNSNPKIKEIFDSWKRTGKETFASSLQKNRELKNVLLEETPWISEAQNEAERKERLGLLFDYASLSQQMMKVEEKLCGMQLQNGGWPWFSGLRENIFVTQSIIEGFGHLENLGITDYKRNNRMTQALWRAVSRCDEKMFSDYMAIKQKDSLLKGDYIDNEKIQYLYARSYFSKSQVGKPYEEAFNFWKKQAVDNWKSRGIYLQGMIALMCHRYNDKADAEKIMRSILDNAIIDKDMGMYYEQERGFCWYQTPIETQALIIEAADEILHDKNSVDQMKIWLLKNKQANCWNSGRATAEACYALLLRGTDWLTTGSEPAEIQVGDERPEITKDNTEAGTGYIKLSWEAGKIKPEMSQVSITNRNPVPAWGALFWQYFEKMDKLAEAGSSFLNIKKDLYLRSGSGRSIEMIPITTGTKLKAGDELTVRLIIKADRDMEFVHIKDQRASGLEPENVISMNKYQDGLFYYESTKDASTNFFIDRLSKGTYVFEYPLKVTYDGSFSNGIATIQCIYAPEFISHSGETHIKVQ